MSFARPSPRYATAVCSSRAAVRLFCKSSVEQLGQHKRSSTYRGFSCRVSASHVPGAKPCFSLRIGCAPTQCHNLCAYAAVYAFGLSASAAIKPSNSVRSSPEVVLTREQGKNGKLRKELEKRGISCLELPLIETDSGPDRCAVCDLSVMALCTVGYFVAPCGEEQLQWHSGTNLAGTVCSNCRKRQLCSRRCSSSPTVAVANFPFLACSNALALHQHPLSLVFLAPLQLGLLGFPDEQPQQSLPPVSPPSPPPYLVPYLQGLPPYCLGQPDV